MTFLKTIKIAGPAGLGIKSGGQLLSNILIAHGFHVHDYTEYPSLVRGGHNSYQVTVSSKPVLAPQATTDYCFLLKQEKFNDQDIPLTDLVRQLGGPQFKNTVCIGVLTYVLGLNKQKIHRAVSLTYPKYIKENLRSIELGFSYAKQHFSKHLSPLPHLKANSHKKLYDGNQAFAHGFIAGAGDFYAAYPMTPSTGTLHQLAALADQANIKVVHPEDEIAVANMAAGAAFTGARVAVGTSGGGFALMTETISFCGVAELPVVFYLVSRPGPATGVPTYTSQGDLLFAVNAGHGEFPKIVLAPSSQQDSFELSAQALNLAAQFQLPVIVLSDKFLAESSTNLKDISKAKLKTVTIKTRKKPTVNFKRYAWASATGVSAISLPGTPKGEYLANSYEHDQLGFSAEDPDTIIKMQAKRAKKLTSSLNHLPPPIYHRHQSKTLLISWGSTYGAIVSANTGFDHLHLRSVWPIDPALEKIFKKYKKIIVIENNGAGQLTTLLKSQFDFNPDRQILKSDGRPFFPQDLNKLLKSPPSSRGIKGVS